MLPVTFETFLEQGASTIDASVQQLQRTYDEVVWGIESPPSVIEKRDNTTTTITASSSSSSHSHSHSLGGKPSDAGGWKKKNPDSKRHRRGGPGTPNRGRFIRQRRLNHQQVQTTPSTVTDVDSLFNDDDESSSIASDRESATSLATSGSAESELAARERRKTKPRWRVGGGGANNNNKITTNSVTYASVPQQQQQPRCESPGHNSILASHQPPTTTTKPPSKLQTKLRSSRSIDEIFGYNTKKTIRRRKAFADQDVGLDFCLLDAPAGSLGRNRTTTGGSGSRSLLIVQAVHPKGLFADTDLGVGDAVLAINGVNIRDEEPTSPLGLFGNGRNRKRNYNGGGSLNLGKNNNNNTSFKPNIFKARALLNGRGLSVSIEYQKFGEINSSSICSSLEGTMGKYYYHNVKGTIVASIGSGPATASAALAEDYPLLREPQQPQRNSVYRSRRSHKAPAATRVDFLGVLRSSDHSKESPTLPRDLEDVVHPNTNVNVSTSSHTTTKTNNTTVTAKEQQSPKASASAAAADEVSKSETSRSENELEAPPKISRLTRLKARTQKLRSSRKPSFEKKKNEGAAIIAPGDGKENNAPAGDRPVVAAPVAILAIRRHQARAPNDLGSAATSQYQSLMSSNNGPQEQMKIPTEHVLSRSRSASISDSSFPNNLAGHRNGDEFEVDTATASPRSILSVDAGGGGGSAFCSPARSTHSESYLANLAAATEEQQQEMVRLNRKVYYKLQIRIDCLQQSNARLTDEVSALRRRDGTSEKLEQALQRLERAAAKEQVYESELDLSKSRLDIANIQADKRQRELTESKEQIIAENDKVISNLSKRIEHLEGTNRRLVEQLQKVESKRQEKYNSLQAQFERLKMKFSAQSTLLDNVMTANEELTSQNEALESELNASVKPIAAVASVASPDQRATVSPSSGMFLPEASEYDTEHMKRDPILLAQAKELSSLREQNADLEDKVDNLSSQLNDLKIRDIQEGIQLPAKEPTSGLSPIKEAPSPSRSSNTAASDGTPCLLDNAFSSSGSEDSQDDRKSTRTRPPLPRRKPLSSSSRRYENLNDVSIESPSDESTGFDVSLVENPSDEDAAFGSAGCVARYRRPESPHRRGFRGSDGDPATTYKLKYQHEYEDLARPGLLNESFESASSLSLMERILELESALQESVDLDPEQARRFLDSLQSRMVKLKEKRYTRVGSVEIVSTDEGDVSVEVTDI